MALRRLTNVRVEETGFWVFKTCKFYFTKTRHFVMSPSQYERAKKQKVSCIGRDQDRVLWWTTQGFYWAEPELDEKPSSCWFGTGSGDKNRSWSGSRRSGIAEPHQRNGDASRSPMR